MNLFQNIPMIGVNNGVWPRAIAPQAGGGGVQAPLISPTGDTTILVISDSLGNETFEPIYKMAVDFETDFPTLAVKYALYDAVTNTIPALTTMSAGSGAGNIIIYNQAIPQSQPARMFSEPEFSAAIAPITPDIVLWQHGKNVAAEQMQNARLQSAWEMMRLAKPNACHVVIREPPNRDDNAMATMDASTQALAAEYGDVLLIDNYTPWIDAGKPSGWYTDNLHPNDTGVDAGSRPNVRAGMKNGKRPAIITPARLLTKVTSLRPNGDFSDWSGAVPVGYTVVSAPTLAKEFTIKPSDVPYSLKMTGAAGADLRSELDATQRAAAVGKFITIAIQQFVPAANPVTSGVFQLIITDDAGTETKTQSRTADNNGRQSHDRWVWTIIRSQRAISTNPTVIRLICENDTAVGTSTTYIARIVWSDTIYPRDMNYASA